jgi:hypothetical protein
MWFGPDGDPRQLVRALKLYLMWPVLGAAIGAGMLAIMGLLLAGWEGAANGARFGAAFGAMGGIMVTGAKVLSEWQA